MPLLLNRVNKGENPWEIQLHHLSLWVQIYDLRPGFKSEKILTDIGNYIGTFVASCPKNFMGLWRDYLRVRISIDIRKPLKRRMKIRKGNDEFWATFKYERLPQFCFICGMLGHADRFCHRLFDTPAEEIVKPYGVWMRAPDRKQSKQIGSKWLRDSAMGEGPAKENDGERNDQPGHIEKHDKDGMRRECNYESGTHERLLRLQRENREGMEVDINANLTIGKEGSDNVGLPLIGDGDPTEEILHVWDPKRRRVTEEVKMRQNETRDSENTEMGPNGPSNLSKELGQYVEEQKNLYGAGSVGQARLEL